MISKVLLQMLSVTLFVSPSLSYYSFQEQIPNGGKVEHPCKVNYRWPGVGHENRLGGGARNAFGKDFAAAGNKWTKELCTQDSDGDGRTNGQELGDPDCLWSVGQIPSGTDRITHPGVCEPLNSTDCQAKNKFVSCDLDKFEGCDAIKNPDVKELDLRFPSTRIPPTVTNYYCMTFNLSDDADYHVIANEPLIGNHEVLHHMLLYGCKEDATLIDSPQSCGMAASSCLSIVGAWTVGMSGECYGSHVGYRIGRTGFKRVMLQVHYNNPEKMADLTDNSGLRLYYQPAKPGVQDMITIMIGQMQIEIPPAQSRVEVVGTCPSSCTQMIIKKPAYVISAANHMHYRGRSMKVELFRNGSKVLDITNDEFYNYDSPIVHIHDPAVQVLPGDEIKTTCIFSSVSDSNYVFYGEGTDDEMCFGFLAAYPVDSFRTTECISQGPYSQCDFITGNAVMECDWKTYSDLGHPDTAAIAQKLTQNCNLNGLCRPECQAYLKTLSTNPCFYGEASVWVKGYLQRTYKGLDFLGRLHSCPVTVEQCPNSAGHNMSPSFILLVILLTFGTLPKFNRSS